ncbi:MAG: hypothetical protein J2P28_04245 [Actinobacteria bacterium]|nr:hypothetical protein [Actinomycetota bacterium]
MYSMVIALVPAENDSELPLLTRAQLLLDPYLHSDDCDHGDDNEVRYVEDSNGNLFLRGCHWDSATVSADQAFRGCLWLDRYGRVPPDLPFADPEDQPRLAADVELRNGHYVPDAIVTPSGDAIRPASLALAEDLIAEHANCVAVPFACHS